MADHKPAPKPEVDRELIHELAKLLDETGLTEIEIERDGTRVRVARGRDISHVIGEAHAMPPPVAVTILDAGARTITPSCQAERRADSRESLALDLALH